PDVLQLVAFSRGTDVVVIAGVKRAAALQADRDGMPVASPDFWGDVVVSLPGEPAVWEDVLRGRRLESLGAQPRVADVLPGVPLTVLCGVRGSRPRTSRASRRREQAAMHAAVRSDALCWAATPATDEYAVCIMRSSRALISSSVQKKLEKSCTHSK